MTVQVMWMVPGWGLTFQLPQQTVIIRIASQGVFTKCSSFKSSYLTVTVEFTPFWGHLQLDHPVTCENIKCYSHKVPILYLFYIYFLNYFSLFFGIFLYFSRLFWSNFVTILNLLFWKKNGKTIVWLASHNYCRDSFKIALN